MKIIAIFIISVVMVYSQSREAEQKQFEWKLSETTTTAYLSTIHPSNPQTVKDYFKSDNFILGWHWGGERIIINYKLLIIDLFFEETLLPFNPKRIQSL